MKKISVQSTLYLKLNSIKVVLFFFFLFNYSSVYSQCSLTVSSYGDQINFNHTFGPGADYFVISDVTDPQNIITYPAINNGTSTISLAQASTILGEPSLILPSRSYKVVIQWCTQVYGCLYVDCSAGEGSVGPCPPPCLINVNSPPILNTTELDFFSCGKQLNAFDDTFTCDPAIGASFYQFRFVDASNGNLIATVQQVSRDLDLVSAFNSTGIQSFLLLSKTYDVSVRAFSNGTWQAYGAVCQLLSPVSIPQTQLNTLQCGTIATPYNAASFFNTNLTCDPVAGANGYWWHAFDVGSGLWVFGGPFYFTSNSVTLADINAAGLNAKFTIYASADILSQTLIQGPGCTVLTPSTLIMQLNNDDNVKMYEPEFRENTLGVEQLLYEMNIYPIPATDILNITTNLQDLASYSVYDMSGKVVLKDNIAN